MSLTRNFKMNADTINKGVAVTLPANDDGSIPTIYVARMHASNQRYQKAITAALKPYQFEIQHDKLSNEVAEKLMLGVFARTVVTGWQNILSADVHGDESLTGFESFSAKSAETLLQNLPELYELLQTKAKDATAFLASSNEAIAGN